MKKSEQIEQALLEDIESGKFTTLPTRKQLEQRFNVSHATINAAIKTLHSQGILYRKGRRVHIAEKKNLIPSHEQAFLTFVRSTGKPATTKYLSEPDRRPMPKSIAFLFGVPEGTLMVERDRVDGTDREPLRITRKVFLSVLIQDHSLVGLHENPEYDVIADIQREQGIYVEYRKHTTIARFATREEREILSLPENSIVFEIVRSSYDNKENKRLLWSNQIILPASRFFIQTEEEGRVNWK